MEYERVVSIRVTATLTCVAASAFAQPHATVTGTVVDAESREPLPGAVVTTEDGAQVVTADDGTFALTARGAIVISAHGRRDVRAVLEPGAHREIALVRAGEVVEISGESPESAARRGPYPVSVVSTDRLAGRATDLDAVLGRVAGVRVRRTGGLGSASELSLRGLGGKRVQVYFDGRPLDLSSNALGLAEIPIQFIDRIEIYKGVVPAWLGGDGTGGAINVVTKELADDYSEVSYAIGSYGTHQGTFAVRTRLTPDVIVGGGGFASQAANDYVMESPYQPGLRIRRDHDEFTGVTGVVELEVERRYFDELKLELVWIHNDKEIQGIQHNIQRAHTSSDVVAGILHATRDNFLSPALRLDYTLTVPAIRSRLVDDSPVRYLFDGSTVPSPFGQGELGPLPQDRTTETREVRQRVNLAYKIDRHHALNLNHVGRTAWADAEDPLADAAAGRTVGDLDARFVSSTLGATHELNVGRLLNAVSAKHYLFDSRGLVIDLYAPGPPQPASLGDSTFGFANTTRVTLAEDVFARAAYERTWRLPDTAELFGDGFLISPAPRLRPESGHQVNAGLLVDREGVRAEVNGFASWLTDAITLGSNVLTRGHVNLGEVRVLGADAEVSVDATPWLRLRASATYQDLRDVRRTDPGTGNPNPTYGLRVPNVPALYASFGFEVHGRGVVHRTDELRLYGETSFVDEFFYGWQLSDNQMRTIPRRFTQMFGCELMVFDGRVAIGLEIDNVTDARVIDVFNSPLPGRTFKAKARLLRY